MRDRTQKELDRLFAKSVSLGRSGLEEQEIKASKYHIDDIDSSSEAS